MPDRDEVMRGFEAALRGHAAGIIEGRAAGPSRNPGGWKEKRWNDLEVWRNPENYVWFEHPTHGDWYEKGMVQRFAQAAKKHGVDPGDFVALGISESGLGNQYEENPTQISIKHHRAGLDAYPDGSYEKSISDKIDYGAKYLRAMLDKYPGDRLSGLQAYSGKGKIPYGGKGPTGEGGPGRYFGKDASGSNLWRDKPQARRILEISGRMRSNPEIMEAIEVALRSPPLPVERPEALPFASRESAASPALERDMWKWAHRDLEKKVPIEESKGLLRPGNIDLTNRPVVRNPDGSMSTVRSMSFNLDGIEVLIPTVSDDGRVMNDEAAIDHFMKTRKHLGMFDSVEAANIAAEKIHREQEVLGRRR